MKVKVDSVETKLTKTNKPYYIVGVAGSKINYFDKKVVDLLGKVCEVEFGEKNGYKTIEMITECLDTEVAPQPISTPSQPPTATIAPRADTKYQTAKLRAKSVGFALKSAELSKAQVDESKSDVVIRVAEKYYKYITDDQHHE